jgi:hypothetical protein
VTASDRPPRVYARPQKPFDEMSEEELDEWCMAFVNALAEATGVSFAPDSENPA